MIRQAFDFLRDLYLSRKIILELTKRDLKARYLGSYLGLLWAFIRPITTIIIFWFVFQVGFKAKPRGDFPFILWLITGMIPWFYFSESLANAANSIIQYDYLVKKVVFRVGMLPIVKIMVAICIHIIFIFLIFLLFGIYRYAPDIYSIQVIYYLTAETILLVGISWLTSSLAVFIKDIREVISVFLQFGFWITPIFWPINIIPERYRLIFKFNPVYYLIQGYRDTFIYKVWFWEHWRYTLYFWSITLLVFVFGAITFRRLRPHFADVL